MPGIVRGSLCALLLSASLLAQTPPTVDFGRDVLPIFKANCYGCHGAAQQMNNFRLDKRSAAMRGGTLAQIAIGNSGASRLYLRLTGTRSGMQMPPTGALPPEQIDVIRRWIDEGAVWPDALAGETPAPPPGPGATRMMDALRAGNRAAFRKALEENPKSINRKGHGGATPLMYAVLYSDTETVELLLNRGADPNVRSEGGASALMWGAGDAAKARRLVEHGADVNARSDAGRTPLIIAAGVPGNGAIVKLLLDKGADINAQGPGLFVLTTPLSQAAGVADEALLRMLIDRGADVKRAGFLPLFLSMVTGCDKCADLFWKTAGPDVVNPAMIFLAPPLGDGHLVKAMLEHGADPNAKDPTGNTILMLTAASEAIPVDSVKALLERKAAVDVRNAEGRTALDLAKRNGHTAVVDLLLEAGSKEGSATATTPPTPKPAPSPRAAVERALPLLQKSDAIFLKGAGCVSCHNNALAEVTIAAARKNGFAIDAASRSAEINKIQDYLESWRDRALQGVGIPGDADTVSYILVGLAAENAPATPATDAMAIYVRSKQLPNGMWPPLAHRPPLEYDPFFVTALSMRALQVYAPKPLRGEFEKNIQLGKEWLSKAAPPTPQARAFQIFGLAWADADRALLRNLAADLVKEQRPDGG